MRKPDPTRFTGRAHRKPDTLKMKGFSAPLLNESDDVPKEKSAGSPLSRSSISTANSLTDRLTESQTNRVTESESNRLTDFDEYQVSDYRKLQRLELRLTWEQKKYLDDLEAVISRDMPEGDRADPNYKRITKNSIIRTLVEVARRLSLTVDASAFKNEQDLLKEIAQTLTDRLTESQTNRVSE